MKGKAKYMPFIFPIKIRKDGIKDVLLKGQMITE